MFALVLLAFGSALAQQFFDASAQRLVQSSTVVTLLIAVWNTNANHRLINRMALFPVAIVVAAAAGYWLDKAGLYYPHLLLMLVFFIVSAMKTAKQVIFTGEINGNKIIGAICLYLLLGLIWTLLYTLSELMWSNAFNGLTQNAKWYFIYPDLMYFSFVTLTTVGYGDISPAIPITRFLVYFQAIFGQFYMAILVASLVGAHMSKRQKFKLDHISETNEGNNH